MGLHCFVTRHSLALCCAVLRCWAVLRQHVPCVDPIRAECPPDAEVLASRLGSPEQPREVRTMLGYPGAPSTTSVQGQSGPWSGTSGDPPARQLSSHGLPEQRRRLQGSRDPSRVPRAPLPPRLMVPRATPAAPAVARQSGP